MLTERLLIIMFTSLQDMQDQDSVTYLTEDPDLMRWTKISSIVLNSTFPHDTGHSNEEKRLFSVLQSGVFAADAPCGY